MTNRAYSILHVKSYDDEQRVIRGVATTPETDRMGDVVVSTGVRFKNPMPLLWQHQADKPVGTVAFSKPTDDGIEFEAKLPKIAEPGALKDRVDEAWQSVKAGLVSAVSIGFRAVDDAYEVMKTGGIKFLKTEVLELSLVTIPANASATITAIRSIDIEQRAALGPPGDDKPPGVTGTQTKPASSGFFFARNKETKVKTMQEQIAALEAARAAKAARMAEIMQKSMAEGRSTDASEQEEFDGLEVDVKTADADLRRLRSLESLSVAQAAPVKTVERSYGPTIILPKADPDERFKGQAFTRKVIAKALAYLSQGEATPLQIAEQRWGKSHPQFVMTLKAADVAGGGSGSGEWGAELVQADTRYTGDFIEYLNSRTIFNQLPLREVPANVTIKGQDGAATGYWVEESKSIPATAVDFSAVTLSPFKVGALAVVSNELLRDSSPSAEMLVRDALAEALGQRIDATFLSADAAGNGKPAGLLNGLLAIGSFGATADDVRGDIKNLYAGFIAAKNSNGLAYVMSPSLAKQIQLMRNALGQREFEGITGNGGTLEGDPVYVGDNVTATHLILLKPSDIYKIGDGGLQVSLSREASIEQDVDPTGATDTPVGVSRKVTNMFQAESTAIKVVRSMNFAKRRTSAVAYVDDAAYGSYST